MRVLACIVESQYSAATDATEQQQQQKDGELRRSIYDSSAMDFMPPEGFAVLMSCAVGVLTGVGVVAFNYAFHEIHDAVWTGVPRATWFRTQPLSRTWEQIMFVPVGGGFIVGFISFLQSQLDQKLTPLLTGISKPILRSLAAAVTLGTANSLGPEGPSVEIGASVGNGIGAAFRNSRERRLSLVAAGSAAGISSGFHAAVAGCFFAVESVLKPSSPDSSASVTTAMVLLSSVLATVVSQAGLGKDPAFKIPAYDFRSPSELPLYLLLGIVCGVLSVSLTKGSEYVTLFVDKFQKKTGIPPALLPPLGSFMVGLIALAYPEVLYWGFENFDAVLESRPWARGAPAELLLQVVVAKVVATSLCRGTRLVGGVYAPSLFIGACLGSAYGKLAASMIGNHLDSLIDVAAPQAYALVGMAAMLAGVCQVPFTAILLLFELTQDYRIILPLMAAVGLSSWVASSFTSSGRDGSHGAETQKPAPGNGRRLIQEIKSVTTSDEYELAKEIRVFSAMTEDYLAVSPDETVEEALSLMLRDKQWCVLVINDKNSLQGILTLGDIQDEARKTLKISEKKVSHVCTRDVVTTKPEMSLNKAFRLMAKGGLRQLPVLAEDGQVIGLINQEAITLACRVEATRKLLKNAR